MLQSWDSAIALLDIVFSLDSVITAAGMSNQIAIMVLALAFLLLIGVMLIAEGFRHHIPKGYVYFAMAFSVFVELLNIKAKGPRAKPVELREPTLP